MTLKVKIKVIHIQDGFSLVMMHIWCEMGENNSSVQELPSGQIFTDRWTGKTDEQTDRRS